MRPSQHRFNLKKAKMVDLLKDYPCTDCKIKYPPYVMQFDHLPEKGIKLFAINKSTISFPKLLAELEKCELVCANCHMTRTHNRRQNK